MTRLCIHLSLTALKILEFSTGLVIYLWWTTSSLYLYQKTKSMMGSSADNFAKFHVLSNKKIILQINVELKGFSERKLVSKLQETPRRHLFWRLFFSKFAALLKMDFARDFFLTNFQNTQNTNLTSRDTNKRSNHSRDILYEKKTSNLIGWIVKLYSKQSDWHIVKLLEMTELICCSYRCLPACKN